MRNKFRKRSGSRMKSLEKPHIVFLGQNGFPCGYAEIQKLRLLAKSLLYAGCKVTVINRLWILGQCPEGFEPEVSGTFEDIDYIFACGTPHRPLTFLKRNLRRVLSIIKEILALRKLNRKMKIGGAIISIGSFWEVIYYRIISLLFSFPIVLSITELFTAIYPIKNPLIRLNALLLDRYAFRFVHGSMPINEFFVENIKKYSSRKPLLKVPVLVDFSRYDGIIRKPDEKYLLFCGSLAYLEVIFFILRAFDGCHTVGETFLYLVVNGPSYLFSELEHAISQVNKKQFVKVFSKLSDAELSHMYVNSYALLIPLRPTVQDRARFPHKIGEYCASGRPIVTTNYGEIQSYFTNSQTAMIASEFNESVYATIMDEILSNPKLADEVGINGKYVAQKEFDYKLYGERIKQFIQSLNS